MILAAEQLLLQEEPHPKDPKCLQKYTKIISATIKIIDAWVAVGSRSSVARAPAAKAGSPGLFFSSSWLTNVRGVGRISGKGMLSMSAQSVLGKI